MTNSIRASAITTLALAAACGTELTATTVEVEGRTVELVEAGAGPSTVVFEAGLGSDWTVWDEVAVAVARRARVFAYSRPGYGESDFVAEPRDATHIVAELRALLAARGLAPPYVLVGHSFGGTYMELFAKAHPEEVSGLVLVDPRHRDLGAACVEADLDGCVIPASAVADLPREQRVEVEGFASISDEIRASGRFGAYPVRVLTATEHPGFSSGAEALWRSLLGALAGEAVGGEQVVFDGAGHYLQLDEPSRVTEQILGVVSQ